MSVDAKYDIGTSNMSPRAPSLGSNLKEKKHKIVHITLKNWVLKIDIRCRKNNLFLVEHHTASVL